MRMLVLLVLGVGLVDGVGAQGLGARPPTKAAVTAVANVPSTERQGGDTMADAVEIPGIPFTTTGTTAGYTDDYDEACPYTDSTSPDVVYSFTPDADTLVDIDMLGSLYDTKIYLYDADLVLVACNDDFYPDYVSRLRFVAVIGGADYYLVIDGWGGEFGEYVLSISPTDFPACDIPCPAEAMPEGEPPLVDDYEDAYNGGCNSPEFGMPRQDIFGDADGERIFCGVAGWYDYHGSNYRDTDWYLLHVGNAGVVELVAEAELQTDFRETPPDCGMAVMGRVLVDECGSGTLALDGYAPGAVIGFWVGSATFESPGWHVGNEYDYVIHFVGLLPEAVATEAVSWSSVKGLFR